MGSSVTDTCTEVLGSRVGANGMHLCGMHPRTLLATRPQVTAMLTSEGCVSRLPVTPHRGSGGPFVACAAEVCHEQRPESSVRAHAAMNEPNHHSVFRTTFY